jgi:hypothetical protein
MGNESSIPTPSIFKEYEHISGKRLIAAIRADSRASTIAAVDFARKEFTKPFSKNTSNVSDYEDMVGKMERYLTKKYDVGDGVVFTRTPLDFARSIRSNQAAAAIEESLAKIRTESHTAGVQLGDKSAGTVIERPVIGEVTHERASIAKERLKEFQNKRKEQP